MIKLGDLISENCKDTLHKGKSKSGLDWGSDEKNNPKEDIAKLENTIGGEDLVEMFESEDSDDRPLRSYVMSIHKMAAELYNALDDSDDPEEWVMEKAKQCNHLLNAVHGHVSYAKKPVEELETDVRGKIKERGW